MRAWRWPARLAIVTAVASAIVIDAQFGEEQPITEVVAAETTLELGGYPLPGAGADALSSTWYCPTIRSGSADGGLLTVAELWVTNLQTAPTTVTVTLQSATDRDVVVTQQLAARSSTLIELADDLVADRVSAIVEAERGQVFVTRQMTNALGIDDAQCAPEASTEWLFAAGDTQRDATEVVQVFNPFPDDVVLDVTFATEVEAGQYKAAELQTIVVPARQAVGVSIGEYVRRRDVVSVVMTSRGGEWWPTACSITTAARAGEAFRPGSEYLRPPPPGFSPGSWSTTAPQPFCISTTRTRSKPRSTLRPLRLWPSPVVTRSL